VRSVPDAPTINPGTDTDCRIVFFAALSDFSSLSATRIKIVP
jgi:hypothetical protein